jgi:hypothetical protein
MHAHTHTKFYREHQRKNKHSSSHLRKQPKTNNVHDDIVTREGVSFVVAHADEIHFGNEKSQQKNSTMTITAKSTAHMVMNKRQMLMERMNGDECF